MLKKCLFCEKEFNAHSNEVKYCSKICYSRSMRIGAFLKCKICNKKFWVNNYRLINENPQYCSTKCGCQIAKRKGKLIKCIVCGKKVYSRIRDLSTKQFCSVVCKNNYIVGINHHRWKGGKTMDSRGYIFVRANNHPHKNSNGYILEHRLAMEKQIGRYLSSDEVVHHINKDTSDNSIDNLMLFPNSVAHLRFHRLHK